MTGVYRQCEVIYTDYWEAYTAARPSQHHHAVGKESELTSYIERLTTHADNECND